MVGVVYRAGSLITIGSSSSHVMPRMVVKVVPNQLSIIVQDTLCWACSCLPEL